LVLGGSRGPPPSCFIAGSIRDLQRIRGHLVDQQDRKAFAIEIDQNGKQEIEDFGERRPTPGRNP
jgi:hypothetical protein